MSAYLLGVIVLILGLVVSVALHELGHMIPAKLFGALVPEYFIGFGKKIWSTKRGGTEYGFKWIPLGGYVRILGMYGPGKPTTKAYKGAERSYTAAEAYALPQEIYDNLKPTLAQEVREQSLQEIPPGQEHRAFYRLKVWQKLVVMAGGITMNFLLSFALTATALVGIGLQQPSTTLEDVPQCLPDDVTVVDAPSGCVTGPAWEAGIKAGDRIVSWGGITTKTWTDVRKAVDKTGKPHNGVMPEVPVVIDRDGQQATYEVTPVMTDDGRPLAGITSQLQRQSLGMPVVWDTTKEMFVGTFKVVLRLPVEVVKVGHSLLSGTERDPSGVLSIVGAGRIAGEVASAEPTGVGDYTPTMLDRLGSLLLLVASLNMALAVFNVLPLVPLDGGHVLGAIYEGVKRTGAKIVGKPDPGPADTAAMMPVAYVMIVLFIVMTVILVVADIINPVRLM